ncbi:hypothetical protein HDU76_012573 [Blyttiomyces sp. JEL0837]|nr:hypothetical protein HDU76_012573 [Blyttiomyces sp. JEL0837]
MTWNCTAILRRRLPQEVVYIILDHSDPLTQHLNDYIKQSNITRPKVAEIWAVAFSIDWSGDLNLLPSFGFPTTYDGLCQVHTKSMYKRVCLRRPDLAVETDLLKVYLVDNTHYGFLYNTYNYNNDVKEIRLLEDTDYIDPNGRSIFHERDFKEKVTVIKKLAALLVNIPMRHCWMESRQLQKMVERNPGHVALMAIVLGHLGLLRRLVEEMKLVDLRKYSYKELLYFAFCSGSPEMFRYVYGSHIRVPSDNDDLNNFLKLFLPITPDRLTILKYIDAYPFSFEDLRQKLILNEHISVLDLNVWQELMNLKWFPHGPTPPMIYGCDLEGAKEIISRLKPGRQTVMQTLVWDSATRCDFDTFEYVWKRLWELELSYTVTILSARELEAMRHLEPQMAMNQIMQSCGSKEFFDTKTAKACFEISPPKLGPIYFHLTNAVSRNNLDLVEYLHQQHVQKLDRFEDEFIVAGINRAALFGSLQVLQYLDKHRKTPASASDFHEGFRDAALNGHFEIVEFLDKKGYGCTTEAMDKAAQNGHYDIVKYLHENRKEGCTTLAVDGAIARGSLRIVRFLKENRTEGCSEEALVTACLRPTGSVQMVEFIVRNYGHRVNFKSVFDRMKEEFALERREINTFGKYKQECYEWLVKNGQLLHQKK